MWVPVPSGESVTGYDNIGGKIYWGILWGWIFTEDECLGADIETFRVCKGTELMPETNTVYIIRMMKSAMMELIVEVLLLKRWSWMVRIQAVSDI